MTPPTATPTATPIADVQPKRRAADVAYDAIEAMISTLQLLPGSPVVEADIAESTGLGRTPVREALLRMVSIGLIVQCRRFWYAYQHEGDVTEGARAHMHLAQGIATGNEDDAVAGANQLMDYLEQFARRIIDQ